MPDDETPEDEMTPAEPPNGAKGRLGRLSAMPGRPLLLIAVGVVLLIVIFVVPGRCSGVDLEESQAVAAARDVLDSHPDGFTPERTEAKVLRQGFPPTAMWVVVFTVPDPDGGPEDFLRHAAIWIDAGTGEVRDVQIGEAADG